MQKGLSSQSADPYLTWQDLLDDAPEDDKASAGDKPHLAGDAAVDSPEDIKLPPELQALLAKKERLEDDLKRLTGQGDPDPEDERFKRMYPVKVHTKESRIEERRLRRHDEQQGLLKQRALETKRASERRRRRQAELEAEHRRRAKEKARIQARIQACWESNRRRVLTKRAQAMRQQERQAEREAENRRKEVEKTLVQGRWEANRRIALLRGAQDKRQQALWLEQTLARQRQRATQKALAEKKKQQQQQQETKEHQRLEERLFSKRQEARVDVERQARGETPRGRGSIDESHAKALECLKQRRQESIDLDQRYEGMRQRALQRRREDEALEAHFDRRSKKQNRFS